MSETDAARDQAWFDAWVRGDTKAGVALVECHYDAVFAFFCNKVDDDAAGELTQDTFTALVSARDRFRQQSSVRTYVFAIARWKLVEHFRRRTAQRQRIVDVDPEQATQALESSLGARLDGRRRESLLVQALRSLPLDEQILLELKGHEDLSLRELAEVFEIPIGTVASRVMRARKRLEQAIRERADDPRLVAETMTGLATYMRGLRALAPRR